MKLKNLFRPVVRSSMLLTAGIMAAYSPAMAASTKLMLAKTPRRPLLMIVTQSNSVSLPNFLIAVDTPALQEASEDLDDAADAINAADTAVNEAKEDKFFQTAIAAMNDAADAIDTAGIPTAADAMDDFTSAVEAADAAVTEKEEQQYIDAAQAAIDDLKAALDRAELSS